MDYSEVFRQLESLDRANKLGEDVICGCLESALLLAAQRHGSASDHHEYVIVVDRQSKEIRATCDGVPASIDSIIERTGALTARQIFAQKIREACQNRVYEEYYPRIGELVSARVKRIERSGVLLALKDDLEAYLPNEERIPGENFRPDQEVLGVIYHVDRDCRRPEGRRREPKRPQITISRRSPKLLERLYELECPEIKEGKIEIVKCARDPGRRAKVAVRAKDPRFSRDDVIGACLGPRNIRCNNVAGALNGERVDVIVWSENSVEYIQNALKPATVDEVILCPKLDRAIVLVHPDQRSLAIGRKGQNVGLAKRLCEWELEILTADDNYNELDDLLNRATELFQKIDGVTYEIAELLVGEGFLTFEDITNIDVEDLAEICNVSEETANSIIDRALEIVDSAENLLCVEGVKSRLAEALAVNGVDSVEALAKMDPAQLAQNFETPSDVAEKIIAAARRRLAGGDLDSAVPSYMHM